MNQSKHDTCKVNCNNASDRQSPTKSVVNRTDNVCSVSEMLLPIDAESGGWATPHNKKSHYECKLYHVPDYINITRIPECNDLWSQVEMAYYAMNDGRINALGAQIPVHSNWNHQLFSDLCTSRYDKEVAMYLRYGWPLNRKQSPVHITLWNHKSAEQHAAQVTAYVRKELKLGTLLGPFLSSPFPVQVTGVSPMSTRPKKLSSKRRILVDLSWPPWGDSVNSAIPKETFLDCECKLIYPTIDTLCKRAVQAGPIVLGWKKDMSRAFLQVPLEPQAWSYLAIFWKKALFFNKSAVMGCRSAPYMCQSTINVIRHFMKNLSYIVNNYIDDFMSIEHISKSWASYNAMGNLLRDLGVQEAVDKAVPPTTVIEFLGILFDLIRMLLFIPDDKLCQIKKEVRWWRRQTKATLKQMQSLAGKLQFIAICVKPGRVFIARIYDWIAVMEPGNQKIPEQVHKDIVWWEKFLDTYNGVSIMQMYIEPINNHSFSTDACLKSFGAFCENKYIHHRFPQEILLTHGHNIAYLEMAALYVALKAWIKDFNSKCIQIECDNSAVVAVLQTGRARDKILQQYVREITFLTATNYCEIHVTYVDIKSNYLADVLSRYDISTQKQQEFDALLQRNPHWTRTMVETDKQFNLDSQW